MEIKLTVRNFRIADCCKEMFDGLGIHYVIDKLLKNRFIFKIESIMIENDRLKLTMINNITLALKFIYIQSFELVGEKRYLLDFSVKFESISLSQYYYMNFLLNDEEQWISCQEKYLRTRLYVVKYSYGKFSLYNTQYPPAVNLDVERISSIIISDYKKKGVV